MNKKVKDFWNKHKKTILIIGGGVIAIGAVVIFGKTSKDKKINLIESIPYDDSADRKILEGFGGVYKEGFDVPFATREVAEKFLNERGDTYQIDILDEDTSVVWISK